MSGVYLLILYVKSFDDQRLPTMSNSNVKSMAGNKHINVHYNLISLSRPQCINRSRISVSARADICIYGQSVWNNSLQ